MPLAGEAWRQFQRCLAAVLHDAAEHRAVRLLAADQGDDVLGGERFEIQAVGGVVVGADGFRIAVDHDGLDAGLLQRVGGVDAAIVEFDALADAVGAAAEDDDFLAVGGIGLAHRARRSRLRRWNTCRAWRRRIRRRRCRCVCKPDARRALRAGRRSAARIVPVRCGELLVGEAQRLEAAQRAGIRGRPVAAMSRSASTMRSSSRRNHGSNLRGVVDVLDATVRRAAPGRPSAAGQGVGRTARRGTRRDRRRRVVRFRRGRTVRFPCCAGPFAGPRRSCGRSPWPRPPISCGGEQGGRAGEFFEGEAGDFHHDVVDGGFEAGRRDAGDVVGQLVQRVADGELARRPWRLGSRWPSTPAQRNARRAGSSR